MAYRTDYDKAFGGEGDLGQRVALSVVAAALAIYSENPATEGHALRAALATKVLNDPAGYGARFLYVAAIGALKTDAGIDTSVASAWNAMAGA
jgi:hypothetical protein